MLYIHLLVTVLRSILLPAAALRLENLALRQQLAILKPKSKQPRLRARDRWFWVLLSRVWAEWSSALLIVQPETVVRWHRQGFRRYWRWRSRKKPGRPTIDPELIHLIRRLSRENSLWGTPRLSSAAGRYRCVYLDPPWKYGDEGNRGVARNHYGTMDPQELCALPVGDLAHKDGCHFWCWITWPKLYDGIVH